LYAKYVESCARQSSAAESKADREHFIPVKEQVYRHIFNNECNLEFHKPKPDRCDKCELYKMKKKDEKYERSVLCWKNVGTTFFHVVTMHTFDRRTDKKKRAAYS